MEDTAEKLSSREIISVLWKDFYQDFILDKVTWYIILFYGGILGAIAAIIYSIFVSISQHEHFLGFLYNALASVFLVTLSIGSVLIFLFSIGLGNLVYEFMKNRLYYAKGLHKGLGYTNFEDKTSLGFWLALCPALLTALFVLSIILLLIAFVGILPEIGWRIKRLVGILGY